MSQNTVRRVRSILVTVLMTLLVSEISALGNGSIQNQGASGRTVKSDGNGGSVIINPDGSVAFLPGIPTSSFQFNDPVPDKNSGAVRTIPTPYPASLAGNQNGAAVEKYIQENDLGVAYDKGQGVPMSASRAAYWYRKAAHHGFAKAQFNLASDYYVGHGVTQNYVKANYWFRLAAKQNYVWAERFLGEDYFHGRGVGKNYPKALYWLQKAADQGLHTYALGALQNLQSEGSVVNSQPRYPQLPNMLPGYSPDEGSMMNGMPQN